MRRLTRVLAEYFTLGSPSTQLETSIASRRPHHIDVVLGKTAWCLGCDLNSDHHLMASCRSNGPQGAVALGLSLFPGIVGLGAGHFLLKPRILNDRIPGHDLAHSQPVQGLAAKVFLRT